MRLGLLTRTFTPELVGLVVEETGVREERTRSLPATLMVYVTLAMWLFTGQGYALVLRGDGRTFLAELRSAGVRRVPVR